MQSTVGNSARSSSATAYLTPALAQENVHVLIETQVTRVIQTGESNSMPVFRGVEFAQSSGGTFIVEYHGVMLTMPCYR